MRKQTVAWKDLKTKKQPMGGAMNPHRRIGKPLLYRRFLIVQDDFYGNPHRVLELAKKAEYFEPEGVIGFRSRTVYHETGIKTKLQEILGIKIVGWNTLPELDNGVFYRTLSEEIPGVHYDQPVNDITVLVYLTPSLPADCGTSFWKHKETGLGDPPTSKDAKKLDMKLQVLRHSLASDSKKKTKWSELDRIGHKFNRMVAFPSGVFHSATRHYGSLLKDGRIFQAFRIGVDWNTF